MDEGTSNRLTRLRRAEGMSIDALAEFLGVDAAHVDQWEQGVEIPPEHRAALAARFGVDATSLSDPVSLPTAVTRLPVTPPRRFTRPAAARTRLRKLRRAEGLSVEALAAELDVSTSDVEAWENGGGVPERYVNALTVRFGVSPDWLLGRDTFPTNVTPGEGEGAA
jgi:transcriptional regulator with XRE-family HTH domain